MLLFNLGVVVSVALSVTFTLERRKGAGAFQMSVPYMLYFFNFPVNEPVECGSF